MAGKKFQSNVEFGVALTEEHQRYGLVAFLSKFGRLRTTFLRNFLSFGCSYLVDEIYKKPVIIYNHQKGLKPFYVRLNDDGKTSATFNVVLPKVIFDHLIRDCIPWQIRGCVL